MTTQWMLGHQDLRLGGHGPGLTPDRGDHEMTELKRTFASRDKRVQAQILHG